MNRIYRSLAILGLWLLSWTGWAHAQSGQPLVLVLVADGPLTPSMGGYLERGIRIAEVRGADALVLQLNTPGGNVDLMTDIVQDIRGSQVPVLVYVAPRGAMAASAGTVITLAGHVAAMAPETAIGAASPVGGSGEELDDTSEAKLKNILRATVRSLAERRGPEAVKLAEATIETADAASANEALAVNLVDFIAEDLESLLQQAHGFVVEVNGQSMALNTAGAQVESVDLTFIEILLDILTDPNIVFLLITIGVQAILIEISSPGGWVAGFMGVVCLSLATYGLGILPVNWFGVIFLVTAFVLFIIDIKAPTHGALTAAGIGSLIVGGLVLFNSPSVPDFSRVSVPLVILVSALTGVIFTTILGFALRAQRAPVSMGRETLAGQEGIVRVPLTPTGIIQLGGEQWTAEVEIGQEHLPAGARVQVVRINGVRLIVRKVSG